jgi:hypothetical protein
VFPSASTSPSPHWRSPPRGRRRQDAGVLLRRQPEKFYPGVNTTGTSFDASEPVYNRLVEFERGGTKVVPGLAEKLGHLRRRHGLHLPPAQGREVAQPPRLQARARLQRRRRRVRVRAPVEGGPPFFKVTSTNHSYFNDMGLPKLLKSVEKVDDSTIRITLNKPEAPFLANLAMPYAASPVEGIRRRDAEGRHAREDRPGADRHRARSSWSSTRRTP